MQIWQRGKRRGLSVRVNNLKILIPISSDETVEVTVAQAAEIYSQLQELFDEKPKPSRAPLDLSLGSWDPLKYKELVPSRDLDLYKVTCSDPTKGEINDPGKS